MPISFRASATYFIAPWNNGAYRNPNLAFSIHVSIFSTGILIFIPNACIRSALPHLLDADRFPCFALRRCLAGYHDAVLAEIGVCVLLVVLSQFGEQSIDPYFKSWDPIRLVVLQRGEYAFSRLHLWPACQEGRNY